MAAHLPLFNLILMMKVESSFKVVINCIPNVHAHNQSAIQQNLPHC